MLCDMPIEVKRRNRREMRRKFGPVYLLYVIAFLMVEFVHPAHNSPLSYVLALSLAFSMIGMIVTLAVISTRQRDEYQRQLIMQSMTWGLCGMLCITTTWGMLDVFTNVRHLPILLNFPIFIVIMAVAKVTLFRRNRPADE